MGTNVFKLNSNNDYEIAKIVPSAEEVKKQVPKKILEYFGGDANAEIKIHRIGINNPKHPDFVAYNNMVEQLRAEAETEIAANKTYLGKLKQVEKSDNTMKQNIHVTERGKEIKHRFGRSENL